MAHKLKLPKLTKDVHTRNVLKPARFSKVNLAIFITVFAAIGGYFLLQSQAATATANIFVSPNGSDTGSNCVRFATAQANPDSMGTSLCRSFQKAYDIASPSDTIEVETGNYSAQTIMRGSQSQNGPMMTFKCATARQCILSGYITLGANNGGPTGVAPSYLTFNGFDAAGFSEPTAGIDNDSGGNPITAVQSTNITITNSWFHHWGCCTQGNSETLIYAGSDNLTVENSEIGPACCSNDGFETAGWYDPVTGTTHTMQNLTLNNDYIHDLFDTCGGDEGADTLYPGQCSGTGYGDCQTCGYDHNDGIQLYSGDNVVIKDSKWIRAGTQAIFVALYSGGDARLRNMTIENNMISNVLNGGNNDFSIGSQDGAGKISGTINILYNTVQKVTALGTLNDCPGGGNCYGSYDSTATVNIVGNIFNSFTFGNDGPVDGCDLWAYNSTTGTDTTITPNFKYNIVNGTGGTSCDPTNINGTPTYADSSYDSPDLHLVSDSAGIDQGESSFCPSTDIDGDSRPQGSACDAGADEYVFPVGSANIFMSTTGSDTGTNCKRFATPTSNPTASTVCATMAKAISLAQPGDVIQLEPGSYGNLTVNRQTGSDSPKVVIRGDPNLADQQTCVESQATWQSATPLCPHGNVLITGLTVCGHGLSIRNMDTTGLSTTFYVGDGNRCPTGTDNMVADNYNIDIVNSHFTYQSTLTGHDLLLSHTRIGPNEQVCDPSHNLEDGDSLHIWPESHTTPWTVPYNITLNRNLFYDTRLGDGSGNIASHGCGWNAHTDLVQTLGYNNLIVTNNVFWGAVDGVWQDGVINGSTMSGDMVFNNNFFGPSGIDGGGGTIQIGSQLDPGQNDAACSSANYSFINNTFDTSTLVLRCPGTSSSDVIRNNYFNSVSANQWYTCGAASTYDYNVFGSGTNVICGTHTKTCTPTFQYAPANNSAEANFAHGWDLHLSATDTCLKGAGDPNNFPPTDFDDQNRIAGAIDAGADAITTGSEPTTKLGDLNSDGQVNSSDLTIMVSDWNTSTTIADLNSDGTVDILDLSILLSHYGT